MIYEEAEKESSCKKEWKCAQRLLLASETQGAMPDKDQVRELERKTTRSLSVRIGGGFMYSKGRNEGSQLRNIESRFSLVEATGNWIPFLGITS